MSPLLLRVTSLHAARDTSQPRLCPLPCVHHEPEKFWEALSPAEQPQALFSLHEKGLVASGVTQGHHSGPTLGPSGAKIPAAPAVGLSPPRPHPHRTPVEFGVSEGGTPRF